MKKIINFLNQTSEITHGDRLSALIGISILMGMGCYLNNALFKSRMEVIDKNVEIMNLESQLHLEKKQRKELESKLDEFGC